MVHFKEVKVLHSRIAQVITEAFDVYSIISVKVEIACELIKGIVIDKDAVVVKDILELRKGNFRFNSTVLNLLDEVILLISNGDLFCNDDVKLF
jgi:hypothetical protein